MSITLAPIDISYTLHTNMKRRNVNNKNIPIMKQCSKLLYENQLTYKLAKKLKPIKQDISNVKGFTTLAKFDPADLGIPK